MDGLADELRDKILDILKKGKKANLFATLVDGAQEALSYAAEYLFNSFQRTLETINYLTILNGFPQLATYRWVKCYALEDGSDRSADLFSRLPAGRFKTSSFIAQEWLSFCSAARKATQGHPAGFWKNLSPGDVLREPPVSGHAAKLWIDQHKVLEATICGEAASERSSYIGYYFKPAHMALRMVSFFEGFTFIIPQLVGDTTTVLRLHPTKQTVEDLLGDYAKWLEEAAKAFSQKVEVLRGVLDPKKITASTEVRLEDLLSHYPPRPPLAPPVDHAKILQTDLKDSMLGKGDLFERILAAIEQAAEFAKIEETIPFPPVRDGFGSLERRIEMMLEMYRGIASPETGAKDARIDALLKWLKAHPNQSGSLTPAGRTLEQILGDDATSEEFRAITNIARCFEINRAGMPVHDWSGGAAGVATAEKLKSQFVSASLTKWPDPF